MGCCVVRVLRCHFAHSTNRKLHLPLRNPRWVIEIEYEFRLFHATQHLCNAAGRIRKEAKTLIAAGGATARYLARQSAALTRRAAIFVIENMMSSPNGLQLQISLKLTRKISNRTVMTSHHLVAVQKSLCLPLKHSKSTRSNLSYNSSKLATTGATLTGPTYKMDPY